MYYITVIRKEHKKDKRTVPQKESGYSCADYHIYENAKEGTLLEMSNYRFAGDGGCVDKTLLIDRNYMSVWIMNINGKTLRSIPIFENKTGD